MNEYRLGVMETKFADIIWANEPVPSGALVKLCEQELGWKKSTTYTMLRRICERGIFINDGGVVRKLMTKQELAAIQGEQMVEESFGGSLPEFVAAFSTRRQLSQDDVEELRHFIDEYGKGDGKA